MNATNQNVRIAIAAISLAGANGAAMAGGMQMGETAGQAYAVPLPEGVYAWSTLSYGIRPLSGDITENSLFNIPILAWSTPWTLERSAFGFTRILRFSHRRRILRAGIERGWLRLRRRQRRMFGLRPFAAKS